MTKVMITGGSGKLGEALVTLFPDSLHPTHKDVELGDRSTVFSYLRKNNPEVIIHAAALTGVRECESEKHCAARCRRSACSDNAL